jgi:hypothetical protein
MSADQFFWLTVNVCPAIVIVLVLSFLPRGASALHETEPFPEPLEPEVTVSQSVLLFAVHVHPLVVDTVMLPVAAPLISTLVGLIE